MEALDGVGTPRSRLGCDQGRDQESLATVSKTTESCSARSPCGASGTMSRSPSLLYQDWPPETSATRPRSTYTLASPGVACPVSSVSLPMAITVGLSTFAWTPRTVSAARPALSAAALADSSRATACSECFCIVSLLPPCHRHFPRATSFKRRPAESLRH